MAEALTKKFNKAAKQIHNISDALVNAKLVALLTDRELYAKAISRFYYVFNALERALDQALKDGDPDVARFKALYCEGDVHRAAAFRADLEYYLGSDWEQRCGDKSTPLKEYEHHLGLLATTQPRLLLAHSYTQHLAIMAGGRMVRRIVRKHLALPEGKGTAAFEFKGDAGPQLKARLKALFDEWGRVLPADHLQPLLDEHIAAFQYNNAIISAFPISSAAVAKGVLRVVPRSLLLAVLALAVLLLALAAHWVWQPPAGAA